MSCTRADYSPGLRHEVVCLAKPPEQLRVDILHR